MVAVELAILVTFVVLGLTKSHSATSRRPEGAVPGGAVRRRAFFVTFEGFGVVTDSAGSARPGPPAPAGDVPTLAVVLSVYVLVSIVVVPR